MNDSHDRTPILIGCGQITQHEPDPSRALDPLGLMLAAARGAADDARGGAPLLATVDKIAVVNMIGWHYADPPRLLADAIGANPRQEIYTTVGGNTPQWLVNVTADEIAAGTTRLALIAGAEGIDSQVRASKAGVRLAWGTGGEGSPTRVGESRHGSSEEEMRHGLTLPTAVYPLFENSLRAHYGWSVDEHRRRLGALCAGMTEVAAGNPYAWFPLRRSADEISVASPGNRMIGFPYPKFMNAIMNVDQGAALLMTSVGAARELGIPADRWVYLHGAADAHDHWFPTERLNFHSSPAIRRIGEEALRMAAVGIDDIELLDIYSCFPSAVQIGREMLGIGLDDPRPVTVTGGLPFHGGPGNNYVTHSIAQMMDRVREKPGRRGLVTGLGWYITKHSIGIYGAEPPPRPWQRTPAAHLQAEIDAMPHPTVLPSADGPAEIETYTVLHDRDGSPATGIIIARLAGERRVIAHAPADRVVLEGLMDGEAIGRPGTLRSSPTGNVFDPA